LHPPKLPENAVVARRFQVVREPDPKGGRYKGKEEMRFELRSFASLRMADPETDN
jgi:hypothetical protein